MSQEGSPVGEPGVDAPASWREVAVSRVLDPARVRAERRVQRFLDAALELMSTSSEREFTVQEVVERSGQSLRSFYQYFDGKYELLLALFEESVRTTAQHLEEVTAAEADPLDRLHTFAVEYYRLCRPVPKGRSPKKVPAAAMAEFAQQLLTEHPKEASRAFIPLMSLFRTLLDEAAAAGRLRPGLDHPRIAGVVLQAIMFNAFSTTISGSSDGPDDDAAGEQLWNLLLRGIGTS
jgi:AcrR family transcriptional regulator